MSNNQVSLVDDHFLYSHDINVLFRYCKEKLYAYYS